MNVSLPPHYPPTHGVYPKSYSARRFPLDGRKWPTPGVTERNGELELERTDKGLEGVPGYFQKRTVGKKPNGDPIQPWTFINVFQRRRGLGVGAARATHHQIPLSNGFINNFSNEHIAHKRRMVGMYKLPFWDSKKYTPLLAHQWNQRLDEHPNQQHRLPIPRTPDDELPPAPDNYHKARFYAKPDYNRQAHKYHWDVYGNITYRRHINDLQGDEIQGDEGPPDEEKKVEEDNYKNSVDLDSQNNSLGLQRIHRSHRIIRSPASVV